mgnify:CR=1 FL=1
MRTRIPFIVLASLCHTLLLCLLLLPAASRAHDRILEKAWWTDVTGTATFDEARAAHYTPYSDVLSKGFGSQAQWVRLEIDGVPPGTADTLVLRIRPVFLDSITIYDPLDLAQGRVPRSTGDTLPLTSAEFESIDHTFVIPAHPVARTVWLRLVTTSTQLMHIEALTPREMLREEHKRWLTYSGLLAVLFSCWLWVFIAWLQGRDAVNATFVLRQTVFIVYTACYLGYHRFVLDGLLSAGHQDLFYGWALMLSTTLTFIFEYRLQNEYRMPRWGHYVFRSGLGISLLVLVLMLLGYRQVALPLNTMLVGAGMLSFFVVSLFIRPRVEDAWSVDGRYLLPRRAISAYYGVAVILLAVSIMPSLGLIQGTLISIYGVLFYGLLSGLFMTTLLVVRSHQMERLRHEQANHLFLSREQLAQETRRRQDQSQLLNMLMHELKTPLAVIDLALKSRPASDKTQGYVGRAIDNMQSILNRCVQTDRLVDRPFEVQRQRFDLAQQLQQWVHDNKQAEGRVVLHMPSAAPVESDLQCVHIICGNLLENALKYGDATQPVYVRLFEQANDQGQSGLCLHVRNAPGDTGLPDGDKVFSKYYRSPAAQRQSGTGLGLFLSHNLARQIGGQLRLLPSDISICFELWLPT